MKKGVILISLLVLSGCSIDLVDKRIDPVAVEIAFKQRDAALIEIGKAIKKLRDEKQDKPEESKK